MISARSRSAVWPPKGATSRSFSNSPGSKHPPRQAIGPPFPETGSEKDVSALNRRTAARFWPGLIRLRSRFSTMGQNDVLSRSEFFPSVRIRYFDQGIFAVCRAGIWGIGGCRTASLRGLDPLNVGWRARRLGHVALPWDRKRSTIVDPWVAVEST